MASLLAYIPPYDDILSFLSEHMILVILFILTTIKLLNSFTPVKEVVGSKVRNIHTSDEWNELIKISKDSDRLILADFYAVWCPPCKVASPIYSAMSKHYDEDKITFTKVDVEKSQNISDQLGVTSMPTFILIKKGVEIDRVVGWSEGKLLAMLDKHIQPNFTSDKKNV